MGNCEASYMITLWKRIIEQIGINPKRLKISWVSSAEGMRFAEIITEFTDQLKQLGILWMGKKEDGKRLKLKLEVVKNMVPYIKLVEINKKWYEIR